MCCAVVLQMVIANRVLAADPSADASITNVVFMGMGEPLHNYDAVMAAVNIMVQPLGLHMSHNKVRSKPVWWSLLQCSHHISWVLLP